MMKYYNRREVLKNIEEAKIQIKKIVEGQTHEIIKKMTQPYISRISEIEELCKIENFKINFVGSVGVGKSTALCHLSNFIDEERFRQKMLKVDELTLLKTAGGRTTLCETEIRIDNNTNTKISIRPIDKKEYERYINEFSDYESGIGTEKSLPQEIANVIVNMSKYPSKLNKKEIDEINSKIKDKSEIKEQKNIFLEKKKIEYVNKVLGINLSKIEKEPLMLALNKVIDYDNRIQTELVYSSNHNITDWIKNKFEEINFGRSEKCPIPSSIDININVNDIDLHLPKYVDGMVDSKGLDGNSVREDILDIISNKENIVVFCDRISNLGAVLDNDWIQSALTHTNDINHRSFVMSLERLKELESINNCDADRIEGIEQKELELKQKHARLFDSMKFKEQNILFYNALYGVKYNSDKEIENIDLEEYNIEKNDIYERIEENIRELYNHLNIELKNIRYALSTFEENRVSEDIKRKLILCKDEIRSYLIEVKDIVEKGISSLPDRISKIHVGKVRGSVNRNGAYTGCNIYNECGQIGSHVFTNLCQEKKYALLRFIERSILFDKSNQVETAILESLKYKVTQDYLRYESNAREGYRTLSMSNVFESSMWNDIRTYWGDGIGNYRGRVIDNIMDEFIITNTHQQMMNLKYSEEYFKSIFDFVDSVSE